MTRRRTILKYISGASPWISLALLAALSFALPNRVVFDEASAHRQAEIAAAMRAAPFFIGQWIGEEGDESDVPREAQQLLRPNAILNRAYQWPGKMRLHLLIVHCSDARDMIGHYPPSCYPSSGWMRRSATVERDIELRLADQPTPMRSYIFQRQREDGTEEVIRVFNAFVLPDGTMTPDIGDINRQSERLAVSVQGVAQVQLITAAGVDRDDAAAAAGELLAGMPQLLEALRIGRGATNDSY